MGLLPVCNFHAFLYTYGLGHGRPLSRGAEASPGGTVGQRDGCITFGQRSACRRIFVVKIGGKSIR